MRLLVSGTDTGVGKSVVAAALARALRARGRRVGVFKPAETGVPEQARPGDASDAARLHEAAGSDQPFESVWMYRFAQPLAPLVAARRCGRSIALDDITRRIAELAGVYQDVLVEGAGGLAVPLTDSADFAELAARAGMGLLIVARAGLGTLNHTVLTVRYARLRGLRIAGLVVNGFLPDSDDPSMQSNPAMLEELTGLPVLAVLPQLPPSAAGPPAPMLPAGMLDRLLEAGV